MADTIYTHACDVLHSKQINKKSQTTTDYLRLHAQHKKILADSCNSYIAIIKAKQSVWLIVGVSNLLLWWNDFKMMSS